MVVGDFINIEKTTFEFNFDLCKANLNIMDWIQKKWKQREAVN